MKNWTKQHYQIALLASIITLCVYGLFIDKMVEDMQRHVEREGLYLDSLQREIDTLEATIYFLKLQQ